MIKSAGSAVSPLINEAATILHLYASCAEHLSRFLHTRLHELAPEFEAMQNGTIETDSVLWMNLKYRIGGKVIAAECLKSLGEAVQAIQRYGVGAIGL